MHRSIHPVNTPCQYTCQHNLSIPPLVNQHTPCQSTDPVNIPPYQHTYQHAVSTPLSPYLVNQHPLSTHPVNTLYQLPCHRTLSINPPCQPPPCSSTDHHDRHHPNGRGILPTDRGHLNVRLPRQESQEPVAGQSECHWGHWDPCGLVQSIPTNPNPNFHPHPNPTLNPNAINIYTHTIYTPYTLHYITLYCSHPGDRAIAITIANPIY